MRSDSSKPRPAPISLLHIDDCPDDRSLVREAIRRINNSFTLYSVDGIDSATAYFDPPQEKEHLDCDFLPRPELVLLDFDMGIHTGIDFLLWLRVLRNITSIPVIMYSGSVGERHVSQCYEAGANHFLRKADTFARLQTILRTLRICMSFTPPRFHPLTQLSEYAHQDEADLSAHWAGGRGK